MQILMWVLLIFQEFSFFLLGCLIILMQFLIWVNDFILGCSQF